LNESAEREEILVTEPTIAAIMRRVGVDVGRRQKEEKAGGSVSWRDIIVAYVVDDGPKYAY
jgi:hypothetical protein